MRETRLLAAVARSQNSWLNWQAALMMPVKVILCLEIGVGLGLVISSILYWFTPSTLFEVVDPIVFDLMSFLVALLLAMGWVFWLEKRPIVGLGFYRKGAGKELLKGWGIGLAMISTVVLIQWGLGAIEPLTMAVSWTGLFNLLVLAPFWLLQSGTEEVLTRGWLLPVVGKKTQLWIGVTVSSLLFSFLHLGNKGIGWISLLNIALFGLLACLYVLKTDNIWGVSGIHAAWNCFQGSFFGLPVSGKLPNQSVLSFRPTGATDLLSGGGFGPEATLIASLVMTLVIAYLFWDVYGNKGARN